MTIDALYYPHIGFSDPALVKAMALYYRSIFRIVPDGVIPNDAPELQPLLEDASVGRMIDPQPFSAQASQVFLDKLSDWDAAALVAQDEEIEQLTTIHADKMDVRVLQLFHEAGFGESGNWLSVPTRLAANYMLFLAADIASKNRLDLVTSEWGAWTGTSYFGLDGKVEEALEPLGVESVVAGDSFGLFGLMLDELVPLNIAEIPSERIVEFRERRTSEIAAFHAHLNELRDELSQLEAAEVSEERIRSKARDLARAMSDFKRSADLLKVKGWFGVSMMGIPAPVALGVLFAIPSGSSIALSATGLALGGLFNIANTKNQLVDLRRTNPASFLVDLQKTFKGYTRQRGGGDMNFHAWNCMEEYVND